MKKRFLVYISILIFAVTNLLAAAMSGSANYYMASPSKFLDKNVRILVTGVKSTSLVAPDGYTVFLARTVAGDIYIVVPERSAKTFINNAPKYDIEQSVTKSYSGVFSKVKIGTDEVYAIVMR